MSFNSAGPKCGISKDRASNTFWQIQEGCTIITSENFVVNIPWGGIYQKGHYTYSCMLQKDSISFTMYYNNRVPNILILNEFENNACIPC